MAGNRNAETHGMSKHPLYRAWVAMRTRCNDSRNKHYGGRGIRVCPRWEQFENFLKDMRPAWKAGLTLDRIDPNGNYEPSNCRWATWSQQARNKRPHMPEELKEQLEANGLTRDHYRNRMRTGWTEEEARSIPFGVKRNGTYPEARTRQSQDDR